MPACRPWVPCSSVHVISLAPLDGGRTRVAVDPRTSLGASCAAMMAGGIMLTCSAPTFVAGTWLLLAAGCTLVDSVGEERRRARGRLPREASAPGALGSRSLPARFEELDAT